MEISTPIILNQDLWHRSGHWDHYKDNMYTTVIDGEDYAVKPMNCPGGMLVYKNEPHSYRDLPDVYKRQVWSSAAVRQSQTATFTEPMARVGP